MAPKRNGHFVDVPGSDGSDDSDFEESHFPLPKQKKAFPPRFKKPKRQNTLPSFYPPMNPRKAFPSHRSRHADSGRTSEDDQLASDSDMFRGVFINNCLKEYDILKKMKISSKSMSLEDENPSDVPHKTKDAFIRFSVSYFSKVIAKLDDDKKSIITKYGFGSLIKFDNCYIPNKFAVWVAHTIDYRSGDIILKDKVISLTDESIHHILDLPNTGAEFPVDYSCGKTCLLSRFSLPSMPSAKFFGDLIIEGKPLSEDDLVSCFSIVALNCFLCPNSSLTPAKEYLGIFEDIQLISKYNWCSFVRMWLLQRIKIFNTCKSKDSTEPPTLGGCLYVMVVLYLDFVNFNNRQLPPVIPRILVWKGSLIREYSDLDLISPGVYGFRPLLDISATCYSKQSIYLNTKSESLCMNDKFKSLLDDSSHCKLSESLKVGICKLIDDFSIQSSLSINMDITSLYIISADLKHSFATLLEHVYSIDMRTQKLVLNMIQLISDHCPVETEVNHHTSNEVNFNDTQQFKMHQNITSEGLDAAPNLSSFTANERIPSVQLPSHKHPIDDTENMPLCDPSASRCHNSDTSDTMLVQVKGKDLHIYHASDKPAGPKVQVTSKDDENVMENIHKKASQSSGSKFVFPPSGYPPNRYPPVVKQRRSRMDLVQNFETESEIAKLRDPLCDITPNSNKKSVSFANDPSNDIIPLDDDVGYVPDSLSPSPRPGLMKFSMSQKHPGSAKLSSGSTKKSPILIDGLDVDQESSENVTPNLPTLKFPSSARRLEMHPNDKGVENKSPEVQFLGEKKLSSRLQDMTK